MDYTLAEAYAEGVNHGLMDAEIYHHYKDTSLDTDKFIEGNIGWANAHCDLDSDDATSRSIATYSRAYLAAMDAVFNAKQATMCRDAGISLKPFIYS